MEQRWLRRPARREPHTEAVHSSWHPRRPLFLAPERLGFSPLCGSSAAASLHFCGVGVSGWSPLPDAGGRSATAGLAPFVQCAEPLQLRV